MSAGMTLGELAAKIGAELAGDRDRQIRGAGSLELAGPEELAFLASRKYLGYLCETRAAAVIVGRNLGDVKDVPEKTALLWVDDAHVGLAAALSLLYPSPPRAPGIAPTAILDPNAELGDGVAIGPYAVIKAGARLGNGAVVGAHSIIGENCEIGEDTEIKDLVCLYPNSAIGSRCVIHSGARIGVDGYGYAFHEGKHLKIPQVGRCIIEDDVEIGANTTIDRGSVGDTLIGAGTKIDNLVHIAHNVRIGRDCIIIAQVGIAGSTKVGKGVALAGQVGIIGHLSIGDGARVAAQSGVGRDVPAGETWLGSPARPRTEMLRADASFLKLPELVERIRRIEERLSKDTE